MFGFKFILQIFWIYIFGIDCLAGSEYRFLTFKSNAKVTYSFPTNVTKDINRSITFKFKTKQKNNFLLYLGPEYAHQNYPNFYPSNQNPSYLSVYLINGVFHIQISSSDKDSKWFNTRSTHMKNSVIRTSLNSFIEIGNMTCDSIYKTCADNQFHTISIYELQKMITIKLDKFSITFSNTQLRSSINSMHLIIGKMPIEIIAKLYQTKSRYFVNLPNYKGCLGDIYLNQNQVKMNIIEMISKKVYNFKIYGQIKLNECNDLFPIQPISFTGIEPIQFTVSGFPIQTKVDYQVFLKIKTVSNYGLLTYHPLKPSSTLAPSQSSSSIESVYFLALEIRQSLLYLIINFLDVKIVKLLSNNNISDDKLHSIEILIENKKIISIIDNNKSIVAKINYDIRDLEISSHIHLAGIVSKSSSDIKRFEFENSPQIWSVHLNKLYYGCMSDVMINRYSLDLELFVDLKHKAQKSSMKLVNIGCRDSKSAFKSGLCANQPCGSGSCFVRENERICDCSDTNMSGETCHKYDPIAHFNGYQYILLRDPSMIMSEVEDILMRFRTFQSNGVLLKSDNEFKANSDLLMVDIRNYSLYITYHIGSIRKELKLSERINRKKWYTLRLSRRNSKVEIKLNKFNISAVLPISARLINRAKYTNTTSFSTISSSLNIHINRIQVGTYDYNTLLTDLSKKLSRTDTISTNRDRISIATGSYKTAWKSKSNFIGQISKLLINNLDYMTTNTSISKMMLLEAITKITYDNDQSIDKSESDQSKFTYDNNNRVYPISFGNTESYIVIPKVTIFGDFKLQFQFRTYRASGIVLFLAGKSRDYVLIEMYRQALYVTYNWGSGFKRMLSFKRDLNDGNWHRVLLVRHKSPNQTFVFRVDGIPIGKNADIPVDRGGMNFNNYGQLYIGGYKHKRIKTFDDQQSLSTGGFSGCIASLEVTQEFHNPIGFRPPDPKYMNLFALANVTNGNVKPLCSQDLFLTGTNAATKCGQSKCGYQGRCIQLFDKFKCDCTRTTFTGEYCTKVSSSLKFYKHPNYVVYKYRSVYNLTNDMIVFGFQSGQIKPSTLLTIVSADKKDYMEFSIQMEKSNGYLQIIYSLGGERSNSNAKSNLIYTGLQNDARASSSPQDYDRLVEKRLNVLDGNYHVLNLERTGRRFVVKLDNLEHRYLYQTKNFVSQEQSTSSGTFNYRSMVIVGSNYDFSRSFQGYISGLEINRQSIFQMINNDGSNGNIQLINKSNVISVTDFSPQQNNKNPFSDKQSEEQAKNGKSIYDRKIIIVAKPKCPDGTSSSNQNQLCVSNSGNGVIVAKTEIKVNKKDPNQKGQDSKKPANKDNSPNTQPTNTNDGIVDSQSLTPGHRNKPKINLSILPINIWLIIAFSSAGALLLFLLSCVIYRCSTRDEGSYNVEEDRMHSNSHHSNHYLIGVPMVSSITSNTTSHRNRNRQTKNWLPWKYLFSKNNENLYDDNDAPNKSINNNTNTNQSLLLPPQIVSLPPSGNSPVLITNSSNDNSTNSRILLGKNGKKKQKISNNSIDTKEWYV